MLSEREQGFGVRTGGLEGSSRPASTPGEYWEHSHREASWGQTQEACQGPGAHKIGGELVCSLELKLTQVLSLLRLYGTPRRKAEGEAVCRGICYLHSHTEPYSCQDSPHHPVCSLFRNDQLEGKVAAIVDILILKIQWLGSLTSTGGDFTPLDICKYLEIFWVVTAGEGTTGMK